MSKITNLTYILNDNNEVLLIKVMRGVSKGYWNAPGGKLEDNETIEESAIRETEEEIGIKVFNLKPMGIIEFVAPEKKDNESKCYIFTTTKYEGNFYETIILEKTHIVSERAHFQFLSDRDHFTLN